MTVTKKAMPHPITTNLIRVLSIKIVLEYSFDEPISSTVIRSIMVVAAIHKLRSKNVRGTFMSITITYYSQTKKKASSFALVVP